MMEQELFGFLEEFYHKYKAGTLEEEMLKKLNDMAPDWVEHVESELAKSQPTEFDYDMLHTEPAAILKEIDNLTAESTEDEILSHLASMAKMVFALQTQYEAYSHALKIDSFSFEPPIMFLAERMNIIRSKPLFKETLDIFESISKLVQINPDLNGNDTLTEIWFQTANAQDRLEIIDAYYEENVPEALR
ncbi:hypothetical protein GJV85_08690 [Sulfurimonas aquatica]|uniref:Uncharacterized protein n=1 Tax=Sulfurimonas aquatica TaxID=2672570 RepID=A0A975GD07_9BACT|nr:hypothetical protein [Sulfurimonas aquatica]QSZ42185.1 hypothetical protein GJV85_08690 [Sulfurimonas aquatica]